MTTENTTAQASAATLAEYEDLLDFAITCMSDAGVELIVKRGADFRAEITDPEQAVAELRELARLIEANQCYAVEAA